MKKSLLFLFLAATVTSQTWAACTDCAHQNILNETEQSIADKTAASLVHEDFINQFIKVLHTSQEAQALWVQHIKRANLSEAERAILKQFITDFKRVMTRYEELTTIKEQYQEQIDNIDLEGIVGKNQGGNGEPSAYDQAVQQMSEKYNIAAVGAELEALRNDYNRINAVIFQWIVSIRTALAQSSLLVREKSSSFTVSMIQGWSDNVLKALEQQ